MAGVGGGVVIAGGIGLWAEGAEDEALAEELEQAADNAKTWKAGATAIGLTLGGIAILGDGASAANGQEISGNC